MVVSSPAEISNIYLSLMSIPVPDIKILWARSGNRCARCFNSLSSEQTDEVVPYVIGEQAHNKGEHSGAGSRKASARYDPAQESTERNSYANIILLCPTCHTIIDKDVKTYTVERLKAMKSSHENKISNAIKSCSLQVTFFELEHTLRHMINLKGEYLDEDLTLVPPRDKIARNMLSAEVERLMQTGMLSASQVEIFLNENADMDYAGKLRKSFVDKYQDLKLSGLSGDDLFYSLLNVATNDSSDVKYMAAGLGVLAYYFQLCEVFEK